MAIARALMNSPRVLFADEPTGNLDAETGRQIMGVLEKLHREQGQTIVMVTHDRALPARPTACWSSRTADWSGRKREGVASCQLPVAVVVAGVRSLSLERRLSYRTADSLHWSDSWQLTTGN